MQERTCMDIKSSKPKNVCKQGWDDSNKIRLTTSIIIIILHSNERTCMDIKSSKPKNVCKQGWDDSNKIRLI